MLLKPSWRDQYLLISLANLICRIKKRAVFATVLVLICIRSKHDVAASLHQQVKNTDAIGIFIWIAGIVMFVLALSWGGTTYGAYKHDSRRQYC